MLMPQKLVIVFTPNRQSYTGIEELIKRATSYRRKSDDLRLLLVYPLPSRIEFSRDDLRADWRYGNKAQGIKGYQQIFEDVFKEVYRLGECHLSKYFEEVQIQQSPNYAYGEEIAVLSEKIRDSFSLYRSYELFTGWLVNSIVPWQPLPPPNPEININIERLFMNNAPHTADEMLKRFDWG
jgi:eukaryotic-like serine/threonine-protein kinase